MSICIIVVNINNRNDYNIDEFSLCIMDANCVDIVFQKIGGS